jgi:hypothetical protein
MHQSDGSKARPIACLPDVSAHSAGYRAQPGKFIAFYLFLTSRRALVSSSVCCLLITAAAYLLGGTTCGLQQFGLQHHSCSASFVIPFELSH